MDADRRVFNYISLIVSIITGSGLNDGEWHDVRFLAKENFAMLTIDRDEASAVRTNKPFQITTEGTYHFGGEYHYTGIVIMYRKCDLLSCPKLS